MTEKYDIGIIGGGPAGYTAALHAREKGLSVIMFEKDKIGGVCMNCGCIPTKTIMHSAEIYEEMKSCNVVGVYAENVCVDFEKVIERKEQTIEKLRKGLELTLKNAKVIIINAEAKLIDKNTIEAENKIFKCDKVIIATGSKPRSLKEMDFDHKFILSSDDVLSMKKLPKSILIVGSGAIGVEWARIFAAFDVDVSIIETAERILPIADIEVSKRIERIFKAKKIKTFLSNSVEGIKNGIVTLSGGEELQPECVLIAVGRIPDETKQIEGITYLGDVYGHIQLAHYAHKQAIENICGIKFDKTLVPSVVYGNPEIAWVGAREQDLEPGTYKKANLLISALGKSNCDNCIDGFIKILSKDDKIIGAHIVSKEASALIHQVLIAMQNNVGVEKLKEVCFAHPTYSEGIFECLFRF